MSNKLLRLNDLIKRITSIRGFKVNAQVRQPSYGFYQVFVSVNSEGKEILNYVSSNVDEACSALKGFIGLMEAIHG